MTDTLQTASLRVQDFLAQHGEFKVQRLSDSARTAAEAAQALGCTIAQIAKSLIFKDESTGDAVLIIASGSNMVHMDKFYTVTGIKLAKADAAFVREKIGYAIGGVPPVAHASQVHTFLDQDLQQYTEIWAAAGTPHSVFQLTPQQLAQLTQAAWIDVAK
ncbi:YbaK/EbsC family protein [Acinetobacter sp. c3-l95]|uniref:YbaK/EbsC family protein n=1 Tax=Acinetobacter sp. c3-l95 TaxID=3342804 RepID=UPI0035B8F861